MGEKFSTKRKKFLILPIKSYDTDSMGRRVWFQGLTALLCAAGTPLLLIALIVYIIIFMISFILYAIIILFIRIPFKCAKYVTLRFCYRDLEAARQVRICPDINLFRSNDDEIPGVNDDPPKYDKRDQESDIFLETCFSFLIHCWPIWARECDM